MTIYPIDGFETAGANPWEAAGWTVTVQDSAYSYAAFEAGDIETSWEGFELDWGNDDYLLSFEPSDIEIALFIPSDSEEEAFEAAWDNNQNWSDDLISVELAQFGAGPKLAEDLEDGWDNDDWADDWGSVTSEGATFDSAPQGFEDFEEEWRDNENYLWSLGATTDAVFDTAQDPYEDFEEEWPLLVMQTI